MAEASHIGKWKLATSENFEEYMKAIGVGLVTRKLGNAATPVVEIAESDDGEYSIKTSTTFKTTEIKFKLGEEFDEERADGAKVKSTITKEGNKLIHIQKANDKTTTIEREFNDKEMKAVFKVDDVVCTRIYKAVE